MSQRLNFMDFMPEGRKIMDLYLEINMLLYNNYTTNMK